MTSVNSPKEKCWICEKPYSGDACPTCGPAQRWGPTTEELSAERRARAVCVIPNCRKLAPANDAFCKEHRDD